MLDSQADHTDEELWEGPENDDEATSDEEFFPDEEENELVRSRIGHKSEQSSNEVSTVEFRERIRSDLRAVKAAGFKVGHHGLILEGSACYVCISCRISKLGISEQAMEAWQLEPSEYLILTLHYPHGYRDAEQLISCTPNIAQRLLQVRIGVSQTYKPTLQEILRSFNLGSREGQEFAYATADQGPNTKGFRQSFISRPLEQLFNTKLVAIILSRYKGMTWTGAEEYIHDHPTSLLDDNQVPAQSDAFAKDNPNPEYPELVNADHILETEAKQPRSLPLISMQFLLRHFVKCTEFCLVCFRRLPGDFEAIKPYVCERGLCLYQYMSLGFGPRVEHEILTQPFVVDLLINFCYISASSGSLNDLPNGLSLRVPHLKAFGKINFLADNQSSYFTDPMTESQSPSAPQASPGAELHKAKLHYHNRELLFETSSDCPVKSGDWMVIQVPLLQDKRFHCRVISTSLYPTVTISPMHESSTPLPVTSYVAPLNQGKPEDTANKLPYNYVTCYLGVYNCNFDDLPIQDKRSTICKLLEALPSLEEMQSYLSSKQNLALATWADRMAPASISLLRWIIASSRACIMQLENFGETENGPKRKFDERVFGMPEWVQFRFATGAPDKERRFISAKKDTAKRLHSTYPTLFAWHGSPLTNWHSIIREGLHYKVQAHGRAYGHGVYHSLCHSTSLGYSYRSQAGHRASDCNWPQSILKIDTVMALNEIVNAPKEFVSKNPHLVINRLEWIQTRYLFVKVSGSSKPVPVEKPSSFLVQDPNMTPLGDQGIHLIIPQKQSITPAKVPVLKPSLSKKLISKVSRLTGKQVEPDTIEESDDDDASVVTLAEDKDLLNNSEPPIHQLHTKVEARLSNKSSTDFVPGSLDSSTLPLLEPPSWATSMATKRLQKDFQAILKLQEATPLHELGWYVDSELVTNLYQWIIELHSFDKDLPLAKDMKKAGLRSIVLELRFGKDYPLAPPFVRVIRPRFLSFMHGGGGHVTIGGALCMELLTNSGWSAASSIESVLLQVRLAICSTDPRPARLVGSGSSRDYGVGEAVEAYIRACNAHGWAIPPGFRELARGG